jgi:hypothetical protein
MRAVGVLYAVMWGQLPGDLFGADLDHIDLIFDVEDISCWVKFALTQSFFATALKNFDLKHAKN